MNDTEAKEVAQRLITGIKSEFNIKVVTQPKPKKNYNRAAKKNVNYNYSSSDNDAGSDGDESFDIASSEIPLDEKKVKCKSLSIPNRTTAITSRSDMKYSNEVNDNFKKYLEKLTITNTCEKKSYFCISDGSFTDNIDKEHAISFALLTKREERLINYLNSHPTVAKYFMRDTDMLIFFKKNDHGKILAKDQLKDKYYNIYGNLWPSCKACNQDKKNYDSINGKNILKWLSKQNLLGSAFIDEVKKQGGLHEGIFFDRIYQSDDLDKFALGNDCTVFIPEENKNPIHLGDFIRDYFDKNHGNMLEKNKKIRAGELFNWPDKIIQKIYAASSVEEKDQIFNTYAKTIQLTNLSLKRNIAFCQQIQSIKNKKYDDNMKNVLENFFKRCQDNDINVLPEQIQEEFWKKAMAIIDNNAEKKEYHQASEKLNKIISSYTPKHIINMFQRNLTMELKIADLEGEIEKSKNTEANLRKTEEELGKTKEELRKIKEELRKTKKELQNKERDLNNIQVDNETLKKQIEIYEESPLITTIRGNKLIKNEPEETDQKVTGSKRKRDLSEKIPEAKIPKTHKNSFLHSATSQEPLQNKDEQDKNEEEKNSQYHGKNS